MFGKPWQDPFHSGELPACYNLEMHLLEANTSQGSRSLLLVLSSLQRSHRTCGCWERFLGRTTKAFPRGECITMQCNATQGDTLQSASTITSIVTNIIVIMWSAKTHPAKYHFFPIARFYLFLPKQMFDPWKSFKLVPTDKIRPMRL